MLKGGELVARESQKPALGVARRLRGAGSLECPVILAAAGDVHGHADHLIRRPAHHPTPARNPAAVPRLPSPA